MSTPLSGWSSPWGPAAGCWRSLRGPAGTPTGSKPWDWGSGGPTCRKASSPSSATGGRAVDQLDLITGDLGGPWDAIVALYVLQHVGRELVDGVIGRIAAALRPGGTLLMSFQEGEGEHVTVAPEGTYQEVRWREADMVDCLSSHGFAVEWRSLFNGRRAVWITVIARRS